MFLVAVACYFAAGSALVYLISFPSGRDTLRRRTVEAACAKARRWKSGARLAGLRLRTCLPEFVRGVIFSINPTGWTVRRPDRRMAVVAAIVLLPSCLAWLLGRSGHLGGFDNSHSPSNFHIAALLRGEQLAPPAPLPPETFSTQEVTQIRPMLSGASRNWELLDAEFSRRLLAVFHVMREQHGYELAVIEGYRSPERQTMLAQTGTHVTNAAAFQSYHQFGLASDCAFIRNGRLVISEKDPWAMRGYQLFGQTAESFGLTWGGRWKLKDFGHVELRPPGGLGSLGKMRTAGTRQDG